MELFAGFDLKIKGVECFETFYTEYKSINDYLWTQYREGKIDKHYLSLNRFYFTIRNMGIDDVELAESLSSEYITKTSSQIILFPHVIETLEYLKGKYLMHVITNGFEEVQYRKLECSGIRKYFDHVITSEAAKAQKPSPLIFNFALEKTGALVGESIMIGDDPEVDLIGACNAGMDQMFVNYDRLIHGWDFTFEVDSMIKICDIL